MNLHYSLSMLEDPDHAEAAAQLLCGDHALAQLSLSEARQAVRYMTLRHFVEGHVLIREGEAGLDGFILLVVEGEVTVENLVPSRATPVVVSVLGPGHLVGEIGVLDGGSRTADCTATTPLLAAELSAQALMFMMEDEPALAAKLLAGFSQRMAQRLRDANRQLCVFQQLLDAMQGEIDALQRQLHHVMAGAVARQRPP
jgi:CRP-like cAMP-binding protein